MPQGAVAQYVVRGDQVNRVLAANERAPWGPAGWGEFRVGRFVAEGVANLFEGRAHLLRVLGRVSSWQRVR